MTIDKEDTDKWLKFLDPDNLKDQLIFSALYIATFESFKDFIVDEVKFFSIQVLQMENLHFLRSIRQKFYQKIKPRIFYF